MNQGSNGGAFSKAWSQGRQFVVPVAWTTARGLTGNERACLFVLAELASARSGHVPADTAGVTAALGELGIQAEWLTPKLVHDSMKWLEGRGETRRQSADVEVLDEATGESAIQEQPVIVLTEVESGLGLGGE